MPSPSSDNDFSPWSAARRGVCLVIAAPSGAGKSTIARALLSREPNATLSISATTRAPRPGEVDGVHYLFRSEEEFAAMVRREELLEHARIYERGYGTPRAPVLAALEDGRDIVFDIDWQGYRQLRKALPGDVVGVFVLPPSFEALEERLRRRGDAAAEIARRMRSARDEVSHIGEFDYVVVNEDLAQATDEVTTVLRAERLALGRVPLYTTAAPDRMMP